MPVKREPPRVDGISWRPGRLNISGPFGPEEVAALDSHLVGRVFDFEHSVAQPVEEWANAMLRSLGLPTLEEWLKGQATERRPSSHHPEARIEFSRAWYAWEILIYLGLARARVRKGDADDAARFAYDVGQLVTEAAIKFRWEPAALRPQHSGKKGGRESGESRRTKAEHRKLETVAEYEALRRQGFAHGRAVGKLVRPGRSESTVRRDLKGLSTQES